MGVGGSTVTCTLDHHTTSTRANRPVLKRHHYASYWHTRSPNPSHDLLFVLLRHRGFHRVRFAF